MKNGKINHYFKRKACENAFTSEPIKVSRIEEVITSMPQPVEVPPIEEVTTDIPQRVEVSDDILNSLERDLGKRLPIWKYSPNQVDQIRRAYMKWGPYQIRLEEYPLSGKEDHPRRFQETWFEIFYSWLEYSPSKDAAYCFPCYLFNKGPSENSGSDSFITTGFRGWKKVRDGKNCAFLKHIGKDLRSAHNNAMEAYQDFLNKEAHIENVFQKQSSSQRMKNQLCLKTSIDIVRWLTLQACSFRGHDESSESKNQGNFLELVKLLASYNDEVAKVVLDNAPQNGKYTSHQIQKELLEIIASRVIMHIREEIGDSKFCILVDEARDESNKEQMALVLRFVDRFGLIQERFFDVAHVNDTTTLTLKKKVCEILSRHNLDVSNLRGQGYDGATNMRG